MKTLLIFRLANMNPVGVYYPFALNSAAGPMNAVIFEPLNRKTHVTVWDASTGRLIHEIPVQTISDITLAYSPDGMRLATGDSGVSIRSVQTGDPLIEFVLKGNGPLAFTPDGRIILAAAPSREAFLLDCNEHQPPAE